MPNPNPTSNRALVRYRIGADEDVTKEPPTTHNILLGTRPKVALSAGAEQTEEIELDPPTNNIAEVEKRWQEENKGSGKQWVDASFPLPGSPLTTEPVLAVPPPAPETPMDAQIVRERARGREDLPPTVTEDEDLGPEGTAKPVKKGAKGATDEDLDALTVEELKDRARDAQIEGFSTMHKDELVKAVRKSQKKTGPGGAG